MLLRRSIAIATIALAATGVSAAPAFAKGPSKHEAHAARAEKAKKSFVMVGTLDAVGADSVTITVKGGNQKALRGTHQTVKVAADASVQRNDADALLSTFVVGDHVMVKGAVKVGEALTASKVRAEAAEATDAPKAPETESHPAS